MIVAALQFLPFLNQGALWGLAVIAAPILIHLLSRRRYKRIQWGAMQFLRATVERVSRHIRLENFLLLLLRILIVALLVLAFARPFIPTKFTNIMVGGGRTKTSMVILIDNSLSMGYTREGKSNHDRAKQVAKDLIDSLKKGDTVSAFAIADDTVAVFEGPAMEFQRAKEGIENLKPGQQRADYANAVDVAIKHLKPLKNPAKQVFIITDVQQAGWKLDQPDVWKAVVEPLNDTKIFPAKPQFHVVDISSGETENTAILNANYFPRIIGPEREVRIDAELKNFGKVTREMLVAPAVDGIPKPNLGKQMQLEPERAITESFYVKFDAPGSHGVAVELGNDPLPIDNKRYLALDVVKELPVLLVNGAPSLQLFKGETDFISVALSPRLAAELGGLALARPEVIDLRDLPGKNLADYPVVVLANVANLSIEDTQRLEQYVSDGGGLMIFPGDLMDAAYYNGLLYRAGNGLLPTSIGATQGDERSRDATKAVRIARGPYSHPLLQTFSDPTRADLTKGHIRKWYRLDPLPPASPANVIVSLDIGTPWLVEKAFGRGRVILCATPCDSDWSDLPVRKFFVPLMHELVYYLAEGGRPDRNVLVGTTLVQSLRSDTLKPDTGIVRLPSGDTKPLPFRKESGLWIATYRETNEPGVYQIEVKDGDNIVTATYAVNIPNDESNLVPLTTDDKKVLKDVVGADVSTNWQNIGQDVAAQRFGIEIWRPLAYLLLVFLFLELFMTSRRTKQQEVKRLEKPEAILNR